MSYYENHFRKEKGYYTAIAYLNHNFNYKPHWHQEAEILWVKNGRLQVEVEQKKYWLEEGDMFYCGGGEIHAYRCGTAPSDSITAIMKNDLHIDNTYGRKKYILKKEEVMQYKLEELYKLLEKMHEETRKKEKWCDEMNTSYAIQILIEVYRKWPEEELLEESGCRGDRSELLREVLAYIEEHVEEELTLKLLAHQFYIDPCLLSKKFNQLTGSHMRDYMNHIRVYRAKTCLKTSNETITEIAYHCGFQSIRNFNRVFKQITGKTPGEYQKGGTS